MNIDFADEYWEDEGKEPTFSFTYIGYDGCHTTKTFTAETWTEALNEFVLFLKGIGFFIDNDSIGINRTKHSLIDKECLCNITSFND